MNRVIVFVLSLLIALPMYAAETLGTKGSGYNPSVKNKRDIKVSQVIEVKIGYLEYFSIDTTRSFKSFYIATGEQSWSYGFSFGYPSQQIANEKALEQCDIYREEFAVENECFLYAEGNDLVSTTTIPFAALKNHKGSIINVTPITFSLLEDIVDEQYEETIVALQDPSILLTLDGTDSELLRDDNTIIKLESNTLVILKPQDIAKKSSELKLVRGELSYELGCSNVEDDNGTVMLNYGSQENTENTASINTDFTINTQQVKLGEVFKVDTLNNNHDINQTFEVSIGSPSNSNFIIDNNYQTVTSTILSEAPQNNSKITVLIEGHSTVTEGSLLQHRVSLYDNEGNLVKVPDDEELTITLSYDQSGNARNINDYLATPSVKITSGHSSVEFTNQALLDYEKETNEYYNVSISQITQKNNSFKELIISGNVKGTISDDAIPDNIVLLAVENENTRIFDLVDRQGKLIKSSTNQAVQGKSLYYMAVPVNAKGYPLISHYALNTSLVSISILEESCLNEDENTDKSRKYKRSEEEEPEQFVSYSTSYKQDALEGELEVNVASGSVIVTNRQGEKQTITAGDEKTVISGVINKPGWVLPVDNDYIFGGLNNLFSWTKYPDASAYLLEYNLPAINPRFAEDNVSQPEYEKQTFKLSSDLIQIYDDVVLFQLPTPATTEPVELEVRVYALDKNDNIIKDSVSSDRISVIWR